MKTCSRRNLFRLAGAGSLALLLPAMTKMSSGLAFAEENKVDPEGAQAKALGYVHHYSDVDQAAQPLFQEGRICANCQLAQGDVSTDWFGCSIFPGKQVAREGWCSAWVQRQG